MKTVPFKLTEAQSREAFDAFLMTCRETAAERGRAQLISITLEVDHIDPLAVLESIYEPGELHFYCEQPSQRMAVAGAEAVVQFSATGDDRFERARAFVDDILDNAIAVGYLDLPFSGPHFFSAFGFFANEERKQFPFPPATLFVPRWQVGRHQDRFAAVANFLIEPATDLKSAADRVWRAYEKFGAFDYSQPSASQSAAPSRFQMRDVGLSGDFARAVSGVLPAIAAGDFRKIVLARAVDLESEVPFHPLAALNRLRERYPDCYAFSIGNGRGQSFIGATPERLVRVKHGILNTEAIAGSAPRGTSATEDAIFANGLLKSDKDLREHQIVVDSIIRRLAALDIDVDHHGRPRLLQLSNVQHLHSPIQTPVPDGIHIFDLVATLHPTPAVGGTPREVACERIPEYEAFDRGLYAGPLGWVDWKGHGEFFVGIRSALIDGAHARAFAGAGIVAGSDPAKEMAETELKLKALLDNLI